MPGCRLGTYAPIKAALGGDKEHSSLLRNVCAGCLSGSFAALISNPVDLVKTRLQMKATPYRTAWAVVRHVVAQHGVRGLWAGTFPAVVRVPSVRRPCHTACEQPALHGCAA